VNYSNSIGTEDLTSVRNEWQVYLAYSMDYEVLVWCSLVAYRFTDPLVLGSNVIARKSTNDTQCVNSSLMWDSNPGTNGVLNLHHTSIGCYLSVKI